ncbi:L,D-transpeptidase [Amorphus orientalis]|uniref:Lipoprotein-anchoring transpeptidase ErfK/SrfK n=1 Tax=Amorphus orientalis TaxID=649198 RepID=A0AAE3VNF6_9HYPH|nr:L,D-transpeptidase [Amorphus orientalis]MDQ0315172.1 lipoprotein-anchoring transpeptidase ErfK/SrfK [Amorphus orientalis]
MRRIIALAAIAATLAIGAGGATAGPQKVRVWDAKNERWIEYAPIGFREKQPERPKYRYYDPTTGQWRHYQASRAEMAEIHAEKYRRRVVPFQTAEPAGTVIIDTATRYLYLVQPGGQAIRYGIGVGRDGFTWAGVERVSRKAEWPDWRPPADMRARQPYLPEFMPGGPENPLGARALYLGSTMYRIHGTNEEWTIGYAVSSGCIRLKNADVADLYDRVPVGAKVIVLGPNSDRRLVQAAVQAGE